MCSNRRQTGVHPGNVDVIFIILFTFVFITVILSKNAADEMLSKIDMYKHKKNQYSQKSNGVDAPILTIQYKKGKIIYELSSKNFGKEIVNTPSEVKQKLFVRMPSKIKLRIDKKIPTGITQEILMNVADLNIQPLFVVQQKH